ncbi:putative phage related protein [Wolbachia endosymbiont of Culex quinquefasciatus JHB]|nr:putative phage related protein [Wolbachia endosymbiont of Culex quinquefasciatus JHB]
MCDLCERDILPDTYKKQRYFSLEVKVNHLKVIEWFEKQLASLKITCNKVATGVYYVIVDTSLISLIIPECCPDNSYSAVDKLKTTPTALITFNKESLKPPLNLHIVPIADLICEDQSLNEVLHQTVEKGVPELLPNVSFQASIAILTSIATD